MSGISTNASAVWDKHVFVKFGQINRIPVQSADGLSSQIEEGQMVTLTGPYTVSNAIASNSVLYGMAIFNDPAAQYSTNTQYPLSVLPITLGSVISIPVSALNSDPGFTAGDDPIPLYVLSTGQLGNASDSPLNETIPVGYVINEEDGYVDFIFTSGAEFSASGQIGN